MHPCVFSVVLDFVEVDADVVVVLVSLHGAVHCGLVYARRFGQLPVVLQVARLVRVKLEQMPKEEKTSEHTREKKSK